MKHNIRKGITGGLGLVLFLIILDWLFPLPLGKFQDQSPVILDRDNYIFAVHLSQDEKWRLPLADQLNPAFKDFLITTEDRRFRWHPGVDPLALMRAIYQACRTGRIVSGGSTITMQTAKLLAPGPRTIPRKLKEILRALQLEWHYSKDEILQMYLTLAPYGRNLEGLRAASLAYFAKEPLHLTPAQIALLVTLPQNPNRFRPDLHKDAATNQRNKLLAAYQQQTHFFSPQDYENALQEPLETAVYTFPRQAYHFVRWVQGKRPQNPTPTTLNSTYQKGLEQLLTAFVDKLLPEQTAAAVIVDNRTCEIVAYVGSAQPYAINKQGYVDIVQAIRSPGSTLKPFVYGLAFDEGWLKPTSLLNDQPHHFGTYSPTNFLDHFHGPVTVAEALQKSLNIPVVAVLERLGPARFVHWLQDYGIQLHTPKQQEAPSLAIGLGGVGIRFLDLVALYAALANHGKFRPLQWQRETNEPSRPFLHETSARLITYILQAALPPAGYAPKGVGMQSAIAFKTGTSYGHRDAWCIGYTECHTVGVWTGRADGTPVPAQMGRMNAAPLLFQVFSLIEPESLLGQWEPNPSALKPMQPTALEAFQITFPIENSVLLVEEGTPTILSINGGRPPYTWFVNQKPLAVATKQRQVQWQPLTPGFYEISVMDQSGKTARVHVRMLGP